MQNFTSSAWKFLDLRWPRLLPVKHLMSINFSPTNARQPRSNSSNSKSKLPLMWPNETHSRFGQRRTSESMLDNLTCVHVSLKLRKFGQCELIILRMLGGCATPSSGRLMSMRDSPNNVKISDMIFKVNCGSWVGLQKSAKFTTLIIWATTSRQVVQTCATFIRSRFDKLRKISSKQWLCSISAMLLLSFSCCVYRQAASITRRPMRLSDPLVLTLRDCLTPRVYKRRPSPLFTGISLSLSAFIHIPARSLVLLRTNS